MRHFFVIILMIFGISVCAQDRVMITQWTSRAHRDVIFVKSPYTADICINYVDTRSELNRVRNSWLLVKTPSQADIILREVKTTNGNRKAIRVYVNKTPNENRSYLWDRRYKLFKNSL